MRPTSASRPDHKLAPVRRECLFLRLLLNELLLFCYDSFLLLFCYYFLLFCWWFHIVSFIIILFFKKTCAAVSWLKMATRSGSGSWSHPTIVVFTLPCKIGNLCKIWQLVPPHGRFGRHYLALLHSRCHLSFLKHFVKIRFWQTVVKLSYILARSIVNSYSDHRLYIGNKLEVLSQMFMFGMFAWLIQKLKTCSKSL